MCVRRLLLRCCHHHFPRHHYQYHYTHYLTFNCVYVAKNNAMMVAAIISTISAPQLKWQWLKEKTLMFSLNSFYVPFSLHTTKSKSLHTQTHTNTRAVSAKGLALGQCNPSLGSNFSSEQLSKTACLIMLCTAEPELYLVFRTVR